MLIAPFARRYERVDREAEPRSKGARERLWRGSRASLASMGHDRARHSFLSALEPRPPFFFLMSTASTLACIANSPTALPLWDSVLSPTALPIACIANTEPHSPTEDSHRACHDKLSHHLPPSPRLPDRCLEIRSLKQHVKICVVILEPAALELPEAFWSRLHGSGRYIGFGAIPSRP